MGQPHKHAEVIKAWADGAEVQVNVFGYWEDMGDNPWPKWDGNNYRVKPKNIVVQRYVSYNIRTEMTQTVLFSHGDPNIEYTFDPDGKLLDAKVLK